MCRTHNFSSNLVQGLNMRVSNSQRSLFLQCGKKYKYRYIHKLRPKEKGNALFFGSAFDAASDILINEKDLPKAKERFSELWMAHEQNLYCKFSKTDLELRLYEPSDIAKLEAAAGNLNVSNALKAYNTHGNVIDLIKDIKKMKDQSFTRDLTLEEERFLHYATVLSMLRKGYLMLESFQRNISPHITGVIGTQVQINAENGLGDSIIGYIDLLCNMSGYKLPNGRILTADDLVVADVKTAGVTYWAKLDDLNNSDQLDSYLIAPAVQSIQATNLIAYFAVAKQVSKDEQSFCKSCANEKKSSHKTCNAEIDGKRCNGEWKEQVTYFCEAKMVVGERNVQDASQMYDDYNMVVAGIKAEVFVRNRESCHAYGGVCEYSNICSKYLSPDQEEVELQKWRDEHGET
jgi:hypothetical protein